jgi:hypothetical protein
MRSLVEFGIQFSRNLPSFSAGLSWLPNALVQDAQTFVATLSWLRTMNGKSFSSGPNRRVERLVFALGTVEWIRP